MAQARALLVLGASGQVAGALARSAPAAGWRATCVGRSLLDLTAGDLRPLLEELRPALVVNAAAYTAVDRAESEPDAAFALNADLPARAAQACAAASTPFVHISTDYVFDGSKPSAYDEEDPLAPLGVYGATKAAGEAAVQAAGGAAAVVRTAWVVSAHGSNFVRTMLRLAADRDEVRVVADQRGCPTSADDVAEACLRIGDRLIGQDASAQGVFHAAGEGETSWAGFAEAIFAESAGRGGPTARVIPITTAEYPTPAARPRNSVLNCAKLERTLGWRPRPWREATSAIVRALDEAGFAPA